MEVFADPSDLPGLAGVGARGLDALSERARAAGTAVTIGAYDGVHRGHQALLAEVRRLADARNLPTVVVTFDRHPATVVRPTSAPRLLTDLGQKLDVLAANGHVDATVVVGFDAARAAQPAEDFVAELLVGRLGARLVVVGEDFHFGRGRRGTVDLLTAMGTELGFEVVGFGLVAGGPGEGPVSSTAVRQAVAQGDVVTAAALLGRPYEVRGSVVAGDGRGGRQLGFPTANLAVPRDILLPGDGIYAGWFQRSGGGSHPAAISVGRRPTFYDAAAASVVEAYLLDFDGDLYGEAARVRFVSRLRGEERFDSVDALVAQMALDVEATRAVLAGEAGPPSPAGGPHSASRAGGPGPASRAGGPWSRAAGR